MTYLRYAALLGLAGLAAATAIIVWSGWHEVIGALAHSGWGIAAMAAIHAVAILVAAAGWYTLTGREGPPPARFALYMWVRASVNNLMPVARIGGEIAAVRLMAGDGLSRDSAIASTVVELTLSVIAVFLFILGGVALLALHVNQRGSVAALLWGVAAMLPVLIALIAVQRIGFFGLLYKLFRLMFRDKWADLAGGAAALDRRIEAFYAHHARLTACAALQLLSWLTGVVEVWVALRCLGHPLPLAQAWMIEAVLQASSSAGFAIPAALGVQEAGCLLVGGLLGLPRDAAAALAVMRRCRDLLCYAPGLVVWQVRESRTWWRHD